MAGSGCSALRYPNDDRRRRRPAGRTCTCASTPTRWAGPTARCAATCATPAPLLDELNELTALRLHDPQRAQGRGARRAAWTSSRRASPSSREQEELDAIRPALDGRQVMEFLGVAPGPVVGEALDFLLEVRLDEGPLDEAEAYARLADAGRASGASSRRAERSAATTTVAWMSIALVSEFAMNTPCARPRRAGATAARRRCPAATVMRGTQPDRGDAHRPVVLGHVGLGVVRVGDARRCRARAADREERRASWHDDRRREQQLLRVEARRGRRGTPGRRSCVERRGRAAGTRIVCARS